MKNIQTSFVDTLAISDVHQEEFRDSLVWKIDIFFTIQDQRFSLVMLDDDDEVLKPWRVYHETNQICPFCQKSRLSGICSPLKEHVPALFDRLITFPSIRLKWLYLPYQTNKKAEQE